MEDVDGRTPAEPWRPGELDRVLDALAALAGLLTLSPLPQTTVESPNDWPIVAGIHWRKLQQERPPRLDGWSLRHLDRLCALEAEAPAAAAGETLLHLDLRTDNMLLTPDRAVVDWPHARVGTPLGGPALLRPERRHAGRPAARPGRAAQAGARLGR